MTRIESYSDATRWLFGRNQFALKLGLEGPRRLLQALGNPDQGPLYLHVAGTNGKGSVCANLAAMLPTLGFQRVGLYTSPHLVSFRERIRVDSAPVPAPWVTQWLRRTLPILEELNPTYFECVTAMAFDYFHERGCQAVVLETGLGGRLDATNIVTPRVSVITSISLDHTAILGDTLEAIWGEKLGIVKPGVPLIVDEDRPALARRAQDQARQMGAPFFNLADRWEKTADGFLLQGQYGAYALPRDLRPEAHQIRNAALSLLAVEAFLGTALPSFDSLLSVLGSTRFPGRTQWVEGEGFLPVLLDGAHNPGGMEALCHYLQNLRRGKPRFFFAVMRDKNFTELYRMLRAFSHDIVFLNLGPAFPRALPAAELRATLTASEQTDWRAADLSWPALAPWLQSGMGVDFAVVCGSLYLLGEMIPLLLPHYRGLEEFAALLDAEREGS